MNKRYEVLDGLPAYGDMAVPIVSDDEVYVSEGYVVKFYKDDGSTWIANFPQGLSSLSFVKEIPNNNSILVVAGGDGYLMNPNHTKPIQEFNYFADEMVERDDGRLILASLAEIIFLDENANIEWETRRISWDGIKDLKLNGNILTGYAYDIGKYDENNDDNAWVKFTIDLDTKEIEGGCPNFKILPEKKSWYKYIWVSGFFLLLYYQLK
jgi:hypothetical protein